MLIDFDKFVRKIESNFDMQDTLYDVMPCHIIDLAKECEADDAVPVVRCKDCKYVMRDYHNSTGLKCDFSFSQRCVDGDWYCANGKQKDGEQDATED